MVDLSEKDVLRDVTLAGTGYRLVIWDAWRPGWRRPQHPIGYALLAPGEDAPIFTGEDYGCSPMHAIDSDECLRGLLGFLTLQDGDTDPEFFAGYTARQLAFRDSSDCEYLGLWAMEPDDDGNEALGFVDNESGIDRGSMPRACSLQDGG